MNAKLILTFLALTLTLNLASAETYTFGSSWDTAATSYHSFSPEEYIKGPTFTYEPTVTNKIISSNIISNPYYKIKVNPIYEKTASYQQTYIEGKHGRVSAGIKASEVQRYNRGYEFETNVAEAIEYFSQDYSSSSPNPAYYDAGYSYRQNPEFNYVSSSSAGSYSSTSPGYFSPRRNCDGSYNWRY